jgi:dolichol-phosphate mannosyltransferase
MSDAAMQRPLALSIVIPTFNESGNVAELIRRLQVALDDVPWEAILVDDDSPDGTARIARQLARTDLRIRCLQRVGRRGLSTACIEGMWSASAPVIAVMDADLQHDESVLRAMFARIEEGADLVIGTRYAAGGGTGAWDERRKWMSRVATRLSGLVLKQPVSDPMSGFFMLRRCVLEDSARRLSGIGFKILLDILASTSRTLAIREVPYVFRNRQAGESKLDSLVMWEYGMLLADKTVGRWIPARFLAFSFIGGLGVIVHMAILSAAHKGMDLPFAVSQGTATLVAMVFNFTLNNALTYRDRRLKGAKWFRGLASFMVACAVGGAANIGVSTWLFENQTRWVVAAVAGVLVGAVWNYAVTKIYTWGRKG